MKDDSIEGIYDTMKQCAIISKSAGGIGLNIHCIRATGTFISGTYGVSNGIVPMLRVYNNTARYVDQGGNKVYYIVCYICQSLWFSSVGKDIVYYACGDEFEPRLKGTFSDFTHQL